MKILFVLDYATFKEDIFNIAKKINKDANFIWFRIKNKDSNLIFDLSKKLRNLLPKSYLILSERADIAEITYFNGVHINKNSIKPDIIKKFYPDLSISYSAHTLNEIENNNADFFTLSPIFYTVKNYPVKPLGKINVCHINKKIFALGGIKLSNINELSNCGFYGIAGISIYKELINAVNLTS